MTELSKFGTATIHEAIGKAGHLPMQIKPLNPAMRLCGPAYTVKLKPFNNILLHKAYANAPKGSIIVADCQGAYEAGYWGDLLTLGAKEHGIGGLVIDGCVRDADDIEQLDFPVFCGGMSHQLQGERAGVVNTEFDINYLNHLSEDNDKNRLMSHLDYIKEAGSEGIELVMWQIMRGAMDDDIVEKFRKYHVASSNTAFGIICFENKVVHSEDGVDSANS